MAVARKLPGRYAPAVIAAGVAAGLGALDGASPPALDRAERLSARVDDRHGALLRAFTTRDGMWRLPVDPAKVSPLYLRMLAAYEDRRFARHGGVDARALARAAWQWLANGEIVSGGSTLTMQTARLLEPRPRTLWAKGVEMLRAMQLEARLSKAEVLRLYLTLAPYGGNLEGVRAASLSWFGKEPGHLTPGEAALLVALPQSPEGVRPDRQPGAARAARAKVLRVMVRRGVLTASRAKAAMAEPLPTARRPLPFDAPHVAREVAGKRAEKRVVRTTLDRSLQRAVATLVGGERDTIGDKSSIAVLVVENESRAIRAYVGSLDFFAARRHGQVDMVRAVRSPGSTLKPFVYGLGFDLRLAHPETMVTDSPTRFGAYRPENFERTYFGQVTLRFALQNSLNVPAVALLDAVGPARFAAHLKAAGAPLRFTGASDKPGLPIALGGAGLSLHDLVTLYTGLANGGRAAPLKLLAGDRSGETERGYRLTSRAAAWQLARILEKAPPPQDYVAARNARGGRAIAYKTGTSYGFRDAWAVGYDGAYTVGVWVGRPDGTPRPGHYGRNTAAPLLFRVFDLTPVRAAGPAMPVRPDGVLEVSSTRDLPANLRHLGRQPAKTMITAAERKPLAIAFPPAGALVELEPDGRGKPYLPLAAEGGRKPLRWLVNGRPVEASPHRRQAVWTADGEGFVRVTVIDARGETASVTARVR